METKTKRGRAYYRDFRRGDLVTVSPGVRAFRRGGIGFDDNRRIGIVLENYAANVYEPGECTILVSLDTGLERIIVGHRDIVLLEGNEDD